MKSVIASLHGPSFSLAVPLLLAAMATLVIFFWFSVSSLLRHLNLALAEQIESSDTKKKQMDRQIDDLRRTFEVLLETIHNDIREERERISTLQRMILDVNEKQQAGGVMLEKSLEAAIQQLNRRMDELEDRSGVRIPPAADCREANLPMKPGKGERLFRTEGERC